MSDRPMARADLVTGIVLFVLSVAVIYGAWTMDRLEIRQIHPSSAPGLTPGLLGIALALASAVLIASALRGRIGSQARPTEPLAPAEPAPTDPFAFGRFATAAALCLAYALGLVGRLPFWLATAVFVAAFIAVFEWNVGDPARRPVRLAWALFLGIATGLAVSFAFSEIFLVRLP